MLGVCPNFHDSEGYTVSNGYMVTGWRARARIPRGCAWSSGHTQVTAQAKLQRKPWWRFRAFLRCKGVSGTV